jgi:hypothetical protein
MPLVKATETPAPNIQPIQRKATKNQRYLSLRLARDRALGGEYYRDRDWRYGDTW